MKILRYIVLAVVLLGTEQITLSQYYMKMKSDSISLESDSALLFIDEYRGTINWQASSDLLNWVSLNRNNDTLSVRIDSTAYYRAVIVEGTCNPVMSDTAFLIEKLTVTGSNQFTVDSLGGVFLLPSGIKVKVPIGAVSAPKDIKVAILGFDEANGLAKINADNKVYFLSGISISTDIFDFMKPIKIKIPNQNIDVTGLPLLYQLDSLSNSWQFSDETFIVSPRDKFIEIILRGSDQKGNITKGLLQDDLSFMRLITLQYTGVWIDEDPCKWGGWTNKSMDYEYQNSGGCSVSQIENKIVYYDCGSEEDSYSATEIAPACKPELTGLPSGCIKIKKGESSRIGLSTSIGGLPLPYQTININTSSNLYAPSNTITLSDGSITLDVTGIDVGDGSISFSVPFDYYLSTIKASGADGNEYNPYNNVQDLQPYQTCVTVYDIPEVTTASATDIKCSTATIGGNVINDNYDPVTDRGVEINGTKHSAGSGTGQFTVNLPDLECAKEYSIRAYATNLAGTGFGNEVIFSTLELDKCIIISSAVKDTTLCSSFRVETKYISDCSSIERGIYHGRYPDPEITGKKLLTGSNILFFYVNVGPLPLNMPYYIKGYVTTDRGTVYGNQLILLIEKDTITDIDGNVYPTVTIGAQTWMAANLKTTRLNDGTPIQFTPDSVEWENLAVITPTERYLDGTPGYCWYNNDITNKDKYGALYNWYAVATNKLCPTGWHVPTKDEIDQLGYFIDPDPQFEPMSEKVLFFYNTEKLDSLCFKRQYGGGRFIPIGEWYDYDLDRYGKYGIYLQLDVIMFLWTSTSHTIQTYYDECWYSIIDYAYVEMIFQDYWHSNGQKLNFGSSVRCIKD